VALLCFDPEPDGRTRVRATETGAAATVLDGDFKLVIHEGLLTYVGRYYIDRKEKVVYVRSLIPRKVLM
jgi:hypothetical protein